MLKKTIILFLLLNIFSSCHKNTDIFISHRGSFVKLMITHNVKVCDKTNCYQANDRASASGFAIWYDNTSHVLTAGHACSYEIPKGLETDGIKITIKTFIKATDLRMKQYNLEVVKVSKEDDLCLLKGDVNLWPMKISDKKPKIGDKVYNIGAPSGIFSKNMVPILEGIYSGDIRNMSAYTIPSMPGASGSPIVNKEGNLVGVLHSVHEDFDHFVLSPTLDRVNKFLDQ